jgi:hypothetical protein
MHSLHPPRSQTARPAQQDQHDWAAPPVPQLSSLIVAPLANQIVALCVNLIDEHFSPVFGTPDGVVDKQMYIMFVALGVQGPMSLLLQRLCRNTYRAVTTSGIRLKPTQTLPSAWLKGAAALRAIL